MHRFRFILVAFLAVLAATFTIELPFTQVNYIHLLVNKKERGITNSLKDTHRLHKTYYEDPGHILPAVPIRVAPPTNPEDHKPTAHAVCDHPVNITHRSNTLRGPPSLC
ncbi:MAG: hypothetical protein J0H74_10230 [Chitinophagaceae bacterium]|nr:hypothetical protein [Chitinophagaceae bacterium]